MAEPARARERAWTWPTGRTAERLRGVSVAPGALGAGLVAQLNQWTADEVAPGRLFGWIPVAFAAGVLIYFAAETEPAWWAPAALFGAVSAATVALRRRGAAVLVAIGACALAAGFLTATLRARLVSAPVLAQTVYGATVAGFVEKREERERSDRIVVQVHALDGSRVTVQPERVRIAVRKGTAPPVGAYVELKARLGPPLPPLRPGGYDFARDLYFQGIGATGFALGAVKSAEAPVGPDLRLRAAARIDAVREVIDRRIRAALPGDAGAIASALLTGKRDAISTPVNDAMYVSSLAHVLSISGYHMAVVAGVVFAALRAGLALAPGLALQRPIKKWAAAAALVAAAAYLVLSGAEVATRRAFLMTAVVLVGVMTDRRALTLRTLAVAALAVMLSTPEAVVHPSFQMSFAATLALVAVYERGLPWIAGRSDSVLATRLALWGAREVVALLVASLTAGAATTLYAAYHFHRLAPYGVVANLLAMPIVSAFVMPVGLVGLLALPFGYDGPLWWLMGIGIDWMTTVALWVAQFPGAVGRVSAFGVGPLVIGTLGLLILALLRTPLRWGGAVLVLLAAALAASAPRPDVLIAAGGDAVAVRRADSSLAIFRATPSAFAPKEWLAADGDERSPEVAERDPGFACDPSGCVARLADGSAVSVTRTADALADDCARAALIVTLREPPPDCPAHVVSRTTLRARGALALRRSGQGWIVSPTRPLGHDRPWAPAVEEQPAPRAAPARPSEAASAGRPVRVQSAGDRVPTSRDAVPSPGEFAGED